MMNADPSSGLPGSGGEHTLQDRLGTTRRAAAFYNKQMLDHLNPLMLDYLATQEMAFIATADAHGECDCSFRAGPPGFIRALDERTLIYPELRGNGVMASMGNLSENPYIGILFVDFYESTIGLHVNGHASVVDDEAVRAFGPWFTRLDPTLFELPEGAKTAEQWVVIHVEEAYIHCSKHVPLMARLDKDIHWATDDNVRKGGDYFKAKHSPRPWVPGEPVTAQTDTADAAPAAEGVVPASPAPAAPISSGEPDEITAPSVAFDGPESPAYEAIAAEASGLALVEVAATRALEDLAPAPGASEESPSREHDAPPEATPAAVAPAEAPAADSSPLPDWAFEFASMSDVDWSRVAEIARRIGEIEAPARDGGSADS
jgi:uncharacterized protein